MRMSIGDIFRDFVGVGEIDGCTLSRCLLKQFCEIVDLLGADNEVDMVHPVNDLLSFLLSDASGNADFQVGIPLLIFTQGAEQAENFLFRFPAHRARVEDDEVGIINVRCF